MNPVVGCHHLPPGPKRHDYVVTDPAVGCHYFLPGQQLPSQSSGITARRPVPTYTAWWQRHIGLTNLPRVCEPGSHSNPRPQPHDRKSDALPTAPQSQRSCNEMTTKYSDTITAMTWSTCCNFQQMPWIFAINILDIICAVFYSVLVQNWIYPSIFHISVS